MAARRNAPKRKVAPKRKAPAKRKAAPKRKARPKRNAAPQRKARQLPNDAAWRELMETAIAKPDPDNSRPAARRKPK